MDEHAHLRTMIEEGKDGLEWYRYKVILMEKVFLHICT